MFSGRSVYQTCSCKRGSVCDPKASGNDTESIEKRSDWSKRGRTEVLHSIWEQFLDFTRPTVYEEETTSHGNTIK